MIEPNPTKPTLTMRVREAFAEVFGRVPDVVAAAPGRINLIGEHVDYNQGIVLPMAIDRWTVAALAATQKNESHYHAVDLNSTSSGNIRLPSRMERGSWAAYIDAVVRQFVERGALNSNVDVAAHSSIPIGAGLASSAALGVSIATALSRLTGIALDCVELARLCRTAEYAASGVPCGIMDMLVSAGASDGTAMCIDCQDESGTHIRIPPDMASSILIVNTHVHHALADGAYAERRAQCSKAAHKLGIASLRDCTRPLLRDASLTSDERRCATHVVEEIERARCAALQLEKGHISALGRLMNDSHDSLRDLYRVSCDELDCVVDTARSMGSRVFGARMTGGGFGGCAVVLCEQGALSAACESIAAPFRARFGNQPHFLQSCAVGGAHITAMRQTC